MRFLTIALFLTLVSGQLGGVPIKDGVVLYLHDIVAAIFFVIAAISFFQKKSKVQPHLWVPILVFIGVAVISLLVNLDTFTLPQIGEASLYLVRWILYASIYVTLVYKRMDAVLVKRGLFISGTTIALGGFLQLWLYPSLRNLWYLGWDPHYYRLFSTLLDPNFTGIFITLTIVVGVTEKKLFPKYILWATLGINMLALYLTYSRSTYLAFAVGVVAWIVTRKQWRVFGVLALFGVLLLFPTPGGDTLKLTRLDSTVSRLENWQASWIRFTQAPLLGHGFNTLRFRPIYSEPPLIPGVASKAAAGVDSSILFLLITTGLAGTIAYGWLLFSMGKLSPGLQITLPVLLVHSLFVNSLVYPWVLIFVWMYAAASKRSDHLR